MNKAFISLSFFKLFFVLFSFFSVSSIGFALGPEAIAVGQLYGNKTMNANGELVGIDTEAKVFNANTGVKLLSFVPYSGWSGGITAIVAEVDGNYSGYEVVTAQGPGGGPQVKIFRINGTAAIQIHSFNAFGSSWKGGVSIAVADIFNDADGKTEIVVGHGPGHSPGATRVKVFKFQSSLNRFTSNHSFNPFGLSWTGGVSVSTGDVNGDGKDEIITGHGPGHSPGSTVVKIFNGELGIVINSFNPFGSGWEGGVIIGSGDVNNDGNDEVIVAHGPGYSARSAIIKIYNGLTGALIDSFSPFGLLWSGGSNLAVSDTDNDSIDEIIVGHGPQTSLGATIVKVFNGNGDLLNSFNPQSPDWVDGILIGSANWPSILSFGAVEETASGVTANTVPTTDAIQKAIDFLPDGGVVVIPEGHSFSITYKQKNERIDYPNGKNDNPPETRITTSALIIKDDLKITGGGKLIVAGVNTSSIYYFWGILGTLSDVRVNNLEIKNIAIDRLDTSSGMAKPKLLILEDFSNLNITHNNLKNIDGARLGHSDVEIFSENFNYSKNILKDTGTTGLFHVRDLYVGWNNALGIINDDGNINLEVTELIDCQYKCEDGTIERNFGTHQGNDGFIEINASTDIDVINNHFSHIGFERTNIAKSIRSDGVLVSGKNGPPDAPESNRNPVASTDILISGNCFESVHEFNTVAPNPENAYPDPGINIVGNLFVGNTGITGQNDGVKITNNCLIWNNQDTDRFCINWRNADTNAMLGNCNTVPGSQDFGFTDTDCTSIQDGKESIGISLQGTNMLVDGNVIKNYFCSIRSIWDSQQEGFTSISPPADFATNTSITNNELINCGGGNVHTGAAIFIDHALNPLEPTVIQNNLTTNCQTIEIDSF